MAHSLPLQSRTKPIERRMEKGLWNITRKAFPCHQLIFSRMTSITLLGKFWNWFRIKGALFVGA